MEYKNAFWIVVGIAVVVAMGGFFALGGSAAEVKVNKQAAAPDIAQAQAGAQANQLLAAPSAPAPKPVAQPSGSACGGGSGGCGCGGGAALPTIVPAADPSVAQTGATQRFSLGTKGSSYDPAVITVNLGDTVVLEGDMSRLRGCDRSFVIPDYGIQKTFSAGDNVLTFVASKRGTFTYSCSMGMYRGTLIVQ